MPKRILESQIDSTYADGQILYGSDINKIIDVFSEGVNANKSDLEKLLIGITSTYVADTKAGLDAYLVEYAPENDQLGFVMNGDGVDNELEMYTYNSTSDSWVFKDNVAMLLNYDNIKSLSAVITRTGFPVDCKDQFSLSFVDNTRTFTLTAVQASHVYIKGVRHELEAGWSRSIVISNIESPNFITLNENLILEESPGVPWDLRTKSKAPVTAIYWDEFNSKKLIMLYELHSYELSGVDHFQKHFTDGTYLINGLQATINGDFIQMTDGNIGDEDILAGIKHSASPTSIFEQPLFPVMYAPKLYRTPEGYLRAVDETEAAPVWLVNNKVQLNPYNEQTELYELADLDNNKYGAFWILFTTDITYPVKIMLGQEGSENKDDARDANSFEAMRFGNVSVEEVLVAYRVIVQGKVAAPYYELVELDSFLVNPATGNAVNTVSGGSHSSLSDLGEDDHQQYYNDTRLWRIDTAGKIRYDNTTNFTQLTTPSVQDVLDFISSELENIVANAQEAIVFAVNEPTAPKVNDYWYEIT